MATYKLFPNFPAESLTGFTVSGNSWLLAPAVAGTLRLSTTPADGFFSGWQLDGVGALLTFANLPTGFIATSATMHMPVFNPGVRTYAGQFDAGTTSAFQGSGNIDFAYPAFVASAAMTLALNNGGMGVVANAGTNTLEVGDNVTKRYITGTYARLTATSTTGGAPIQTPAHGPLMGGTTFTIAGTGFTLGTPTVDVDGNPATGVVVDSDIQITCVSPAFGGIAGPQNVVVTVLGVTATVTNGFLYDATPTNGWYLDVTGTNGYQYFDADPGAPWVLQDTAPSLSQTVGALQDQPCPWFIPTYIIRLTDPAVYADLVATYGLGPTPIILGLSPDDAVTITGAPLNLDPSDAAQSVWPQVYVDPAAPFVLGVGISLSDGGGTVAVSYATPFGRPCDDALWKWQALVVLEPLGITYDAVTNPAPAYTSAVVPPGDAVPDGALLTGGPGFGAGHTTPCGCPSE